jgi:hypothetical protein
MNATRTSVSYDKPTREGIYGDRLALKANGQGSGAIDCGYVVGPACTGMWIALWARRTPGKSVELAVLEFIYLCVLSVVLLLLLHWGPPQL